MAQETQGGEGTHEGGGTESEEGEDMADRTKQEMNESELL